MEFSKRLVWVQCSILTVVLSIFLSPVVGGVRPVVPSSKVDKPTTSISSVEKDISTPLTTVPVPSMSSSAPILNPNSIPETPSFVPFSIPSSSSSSSSSSAAKPGGSWCVASQTAPRPALQAALDYACGHGADCGAIQPGGACFYPNTLHAHASYAFNSYYQLTPVPNSCNFGGTALVTSTDPSSSTCMYSSTSTSSSVLDTANSNISTVFGVGPPGSPMSASAHINRIPSASRSIMLVLLLLRYVFRQL